MSRENTRSKYFQNAQLTFYDLLFSFVALLRGRRGRKHFFFVVGIARQSQPASGSADLGTTRAASPPRVRFLSLCKFRSVSFWPRTRHRQTTRRTRLWGHLSRARVGRSAWLPTVFFPDQRLTNYGSVNFGGGQILACRRRPPAPRSSAWIFSLCRQCRFCRAAA